jgi:thiamine biosynthesis protein ThiI
MQYIVRLGADIVIKSNRIRNRFVGRLIRNVRTACQQAGVSIEVDREWSRFFVRSEQPEVLDILRRIFGISSVSPVEHVCHADLDAIAALVGEHYREKVAGKTFAVRAKRVGQHSYTSMDLAKKVGAALYDGSAGVKLKHPQVEIFIEVRDNEAHIFSERVPGPGGLPLGSSGRVLCLLSGGFDSAVAAWMLQKRGVELDYLFCNLAGESYEKSVLGLAKLLTDQWSSGTAPRLFVVNMEAVTHEIRTKVKPSHAQVILKRAFYRLAEKVAARTEAAAILTGECLGQVSSQTLLNLRAIEHVATLPVLRPLIGYDKDEIIALARRIGTYAISAGVEEYCQLVPEKPVTACSIDSADRQEQLMDLGVLDHAVAGIRSIDLVHLNPAELVVPFLYREEVGPDDVLVDCRNEETFALWHPPGAVNIEFYDLLTDPTLLDKKKSYVLCCPVGLQSAVLAERLQKLGYKVHSFRGGIPAVKKFFNLVP